MYEVSVERSFKASHCLPLGDGAVEQPHEHLWRVTAEFRCRTLDESTGMVIDFVEADAALQAVTDELDGTDLNALEAFAQRPPSAERVAQWIAEALQQRLPRPELLYRLGVTEAPRCAAAFYPRGGLDDERPAT